MIFHRFFHLIIAVATGIFLWGNMPVFLYAQTVDIEFVRFNQLTLPDDNDPVTIVEILFNIIGLDVLGDSGESTAGGGPSLFTRPMFYPTPFRLADGSTLRYDLSEPADIDIFVYDLRANLIASQHFFAGDTGGAFGINDVPVDAAFLGTSSLPAGVYFYVITSGGKVIGKGKFAILP